MPLLSQTLADAVARDGLPRVATADDDTQHVLFLDAGVVRSMLASAWPPPLPSDPTPLEIAAAIAAKDAQAAQDAADASALRTRVRTLAQSAVGLSIDVLTAGQIKALVILLLHKEAAINKAGIVRPLDEWMR
jgi:hypothetical protein